MASESQGPNPPRPSVLQSMLARLRGMGQALKPSETPEPDAAEELLPTWDTPAEQPAGQQVPQGQPVADVPDVPVIQPVTETQDTSVAQVLTQEIDLVPPANGPAAQLAAAAAAAEDEALRTA